ncbi:hypothetical protein BEN74_16185 [Acinetobacter sp. WCHAc010034]|uniref:hypothetical protein n=1 Tax=Acinetobacter sp. WCHAc010034 TaxID=1879049 RepID=UPI00083B592B|nr:hypothetical protein [Acinetobacter sp. WCHAc010034]AYA04185.1 hypothetical protein BEN74_16185 [Acinetobacter sp. WCHAc010034]
MEIPSPFQRDLRGIPLRERILLKKFPHPNLLPEPYMAQEKELSILILLLINDHLLIYEIDLFEGL